MGQSEAKRNSPPEWIWLGTLILIGLVLLVLRVIWLQRAGPWTGKDIFVYMSLADSLAAGRGFVRDFVCFFWYPYPSAAGVPEDWINPLLPMLMAPFVKVLGREPLAYALPVLLLHSFGLPLAVRHLARRLGATPMLAFLCGLVSLFQPDMLIDGSVPVTDIPMTVLLVLAVAAALTDQPTLRSAAVAGLWLGLSALIKPTANLFLPVLVLSFAFRRRNARAVLSREALLLVAVALAVQAPWLIRNQILFGDPLHTVYRPVLGLIGQGKARAREVFEGVWWNQPAPSFFDRYHDRPPAEVVATTCRDLVVSVVRIFLPGYRIGPLRWPITVGCVFAIVGLWQTRRDWRTQICLLMMAALVLFNSVIWYPAEVRYFYPVRPLAIVFGWFGFDAWLRSLRTVPTTARGWLLPLAALPWVAIGSQVLFTYCPGLNQAAEPALRDELALHVLLREQTPPGTVFLDAGSAPRGNWYAERPAVQMPRLATPADIAEVIAQYHCRYAVLQEILEPNTVPREKLQSLGWTVDLRLEHGELLRHPDAPPLSPADPAP